MSNRRSTDRTPSMLTGCWPWLGASAGHALSHRAALAALAACRVEPADSERSADEHLSARRAAALRGLFPLLSAWHAPAAYVEQVSAAYRELHEATDTIDLEARRRRIERSMRMPPASLDARLAAVTR
jgi:hypothetical protein